MVLNLIRTFSRKGLYGITGNLLLAISEGIAAHHPIGDTVTQNIWSSVVAGLFTGAVAALLRVIKWDPQK